MPAIWGCVDFSDVALDAVLAGAMQKPLEKYRIDRFDACVQGNALMGCGHQYIGVNAGREALPVCDRARGLLFTADAMLDNRRELAGILAPGEGSVPDGELLYRAYLKWGRDVNSHLRGAYAFAVYDDNSKTLMVSADHYFTRAVYTCRQGSRVYFGTCIGSILAALQRPPALNERWMADYLSVAGIRFVSEPFETPYDGIERVGPYRYRLFGPQQAQRIEFWNPLALPPLRLENDDAYRERFLAIMRAAAAEIAETKAQTGVLLSSGMDSASVAALTAEALAGEERELFGYTSVPSAGYEAISNRFVTEDETEGVLALCRRHPNIRPAFCPLDGMDALTNIDEIFDFYEIPFTTAPNMMWMHALAGQAHADGCRILMNGQIGNATISWGSAFDLATTQLYGGHPFKAVGTMNRFGRMVGFSRKKLMLSWLQGCFPRLMGVRPPAEDEVLEQTLVNKAFAKRQGSVGRYRSQGLIAGSPYYYSRKKSRELLFRQDAATVLGEAETKLGLARGVVVRDLTRDKRVWEFCLAAPMSCFFSDPSGRRLVRDYLKELLVPEISENLVRYGHQSADWVYRLARLWPQNREKLRQAYAAPGLAGYIDTAKAQRLLDGAADLTAPEFEDELAELVGDYPAALFLAGLLDGEQG